MRGMGPRTDFSYIPEVFEDTKMRSGFYAFFHIALLNDFGSFALCMSDMPFGYAHFSTDSAPSLFVVHVLCPNAFVLLCVFNVSVSIGEVVT